MPNAADKEDLAEELAAGMQLIFNNATHYLEKVPKNDRTWINCDDIRAMFIGIAGDAAFYIELAKDKTS